MSLAIQVKENAFIACQDKLVLRSRYNLSRKQTDTNNILHLLQGSTQSVFLTWLRSQ